MKKGKRRCAAVLAVLLVLVLCITASAVSVGDAPAAGELLREGVPAEGDTEIEFFDDLKAERRVRDTLFVIGAALVLFGVGGYICMLVWRCVHKRRDRTQETREGILHEIERAEQRNRQENELNEKNDAPKAPAAVMPVQAVKEAPLVPSTPVSMQPAEKPRMRPVTGGVPQPVQPMTVRPVQPAEPQEKEKKEKYDVDEILREIREGKI